jgi:hypothetical protein
LNSESKFRITAPIRKRIFLELGKPVPHNYFCSITALGATLSLCGVDNGGRNMGFEAGPFPNGAIGGGVMLSGWGADTGAAELGV